MRGGLLAVLVAAPVAAGLGGPERCVGRWKEPCALACGRVLIARAERAFLANRHSTRLPRGCENQLIYPPYYVRVGAKGYELWRTHRNTLTQLIEQVEAPDKPATLPTCRCPARPKAGPGRRMVRPRPLPKVARYRIGGAVVLEPEETAR